MLYQKQIVLLFPFFHLIFIVLIFVCATHMFFRKYILRTRNAFKHIVLSMYRNRNLTVVYYTPHYLGRGNMKINYLSEYFMYKETNL